MLDDSNTSHACQPDPMAWVRTELESVDIGDKRLNIWSRGESTF